ncbi:hypothetical protein ACP4I1_36970 [Streptomyces sp. WG4]|uniref:hypothetical protein n=1 Tax=Streptomyces sp. WG4 TaxID=3417649 RepID=UPI003CEF6F8A
MAQWAPQVHQVAQGAGGLVGCLPSLAGFDVPVGQVAGAVWAGRRKVGGEVKVLDGEVKQVVVG